VVSFNQSGTQHHIVAVQPMNGMIVVANLTGAGGKTVFSVEDFISGELRHDNRVYHVEPGIPIISIKEP